MCSLFYCRVSIACAKLELGFLWTKHACYALIYWHCVCWLLDALSSSRVCYSAYIWLLRYEHTRCNRTDVQIDGWHAAGILTRFELIIIVHHCHMPTFGRRWDWIVWWGMLLHSWICRYCFGWIRPHALYEFLVGHIFVFLNAVARILCKYSCMRNEQKYSNRCYCWNFNVTCYARYVLPRCN